MTCANSKIGAFSDWAGGVSDVNWPPNTALTLTRLVSDTRKFNRGLRQLMHVDLHWLDGTWQTAAFQSLMWPVDDIFVLPDATSIQSQLVWASGICCCRSDCLELTE